MTAHGDEQGDHRSHAGRLSGLVRSLLGNIPWSERLEREEQFQYERPAGGSLRIHNPAGNVAVCGEDREDIAVHALKVARAECEEGALELMDQIDLVATRFGGALELEVQIPRRWNRRGTVNLEVQLPRELAVELSAANGRIDIEGVRGMVRARSSNGSAIIRDVVGDISVATSNAKVLCTRTVGRLVARSRDGKIELQGHSGSVDACTSNGLIRASLHEVGEEGILLATSNGRIVLDLPEKLDADVDVRVDNGTIRNDLQLCRCTRESNGRMLGRLGAGGCLIKLRTTNGSVSLR